jgi:hypothetical protein
MERSCNSGFLFKIDTEYDWLNSSKVFELDFDIQYFLKFDTHISGIRVNICCIYLGERRQPVWGR